MRDVDQRGFRGKVQRMVGGRDGEGNEEGRRGREVVVYRYAMWMAGVVLV